MEEDRIRLRLHWGGNFQPLASESQWRYVGGEVFNESVPAICMYADLCLKLNEKVGYTTSIKYQAPGEDLVPDELVSITGDDDLRELYDEYRNAMRRPGTPVKTFRVKMFLFPALQTELDTDTRLLEAHMQDFDPDEWCEPAEDEDETDLSGPVFSALEAQGPASTAPSDMLWEQHPQAQEVGYAAPSPELVQAVMGRYTEQVFGGRHRGQEEQALDQYAFGNLLQSVSRSTIMQHRMRITEEMDLLDPYHEQDDVDARVTAAMLQQRQRQELRNVLQQPPVISGGVHAAGPAFQQQQQDPSRAYAWGMDLSEARDDHNTDHLTALVRLQAHLGPKHVSGADRYASLVGNLPSHISIFGSDGGQGGRALSAGADDAGLEDELVAGARANQHKRSGFQLPSHISIFGTSNHDLDEADMTELARLRKVPPVITAAGLGSGGQHDSKCITQEFSRGGSLVRPAEVCLEQGPGSCGEGGSDSPPVSTPMLLKEVVQVPINEVQILRKIGEGAFGEVSLANVSSHGLVAVKWLKKDRFAKYSESFMREAEVLAKLNHPNIIRMYGVVIEPMEKGHSGSSFIDSSSRDSGSSSSQHSCLTEQPSIIAGIMTDYVRGGSMSGQLRAAKRRPTLKERCQVAVQAARGMAFLHAQNPAVIHFDLKPDNLLVDGDGDTLHVKVADFGLSKHKFQTFVSCRDLRGTLPYMAPELVSNPNQVSERCDVWSMGVVMWEMYTLEIPYNKMSAQQILLALMHGNIHLHIPSSCEPEWRGLIEMCMDPKPESRPSFKQLTIILDKMLRQLM